MSVWSRWLLGATAGTEMWLGAKMHQGWLDWINTRFMHWMCWCRRCWLSGDDVLRLRQRCLLTPNA